ncbi:MAG: UDP-N-acetylmuramoyl-L-alanyl-D-glutamate--2,6-diaminopimelate ligase [Chlorobiaceae bacterium]|nr:UDP-N-acetylmuramoyl-L-alanyl-D-glutamate--2,6-diaminopimelate ligase [Chlorobiaceae bacterium]
MLLPDLIRQIPVLEAAGGGTASVAVTMICSDSREVLPGALFVAVRGFAADGHRFIRSAVERGASAVLCEEFPPLLPDPSVPYLRVEDARKALALAARRFYDFASDALNIIGVTGTNGKTTTARLVTTMLNACGVKAGYIGTNLCAFNDLEIPLERTTPEAHILHALFRRMLDGGCTAAVMEVSSHALVLQRVYGITFRAAVFTNLSMEHLDFHETMQEYARAKQQLFDQLAPDGFAVINSDDPWAEAMVSKIKPEKRLCCTLDRTVPVAADAARRYSAGIISQSIASATIRLCFPDTQQTINTVLPGRYNVMNLLEAAAVGSGMGLSSHAVATALNAMPEVAGRMERILVPGRQEFAFVDYAHTPDALFNALSTLNALKAPAARLVVVFGCGGNRDRMKRPEMGRIAAENADLVILTSDNPRDEDPEKIIDEIEKGMTEHNHKRITDRALAVRTAVALLQPGDVLLVAGKGHEQYQETAGKKHFFSDQETLRIAFIQENSGEPETESVCRDY